MTHTLRPSCSIWKPATYHGNIGLCFRLVIMLNSIIPFLILGGSPKGNKISGVKCNWKGII